MKRHFWARSISFLQNRVRSGRGFALDALFPEKCLRCQRYGDWFCPECALTLKVGTSFRCGGCHQPSPFGAYCPACREKFALDGLIVAGDYRNQDIAGLVKAYKYRGLKQLAWLLADIMSKRWQSLSAGNFTVPDPELALILDELFPLPAVFNDGAKTLIPVPLHPRRLRWRGFDQSAELAQILLQRRSDLRPPDGRLIRRRYQRPQAKLSKARRLNNLKNAFAWQGPALENEIVILIDDVASTGTTLNECARVLKKAGAASVWGLVAAQSA